MAAGIWLKPGTQPGENGKYTMEFWVELDEIDPECGLPYSRNVIIISADSGTDEHTGEEQTGIWMRGVGSYAAGAGQDILQISSHGIITTGGIGYQIGRILGGTVSASGVFAPIANISDASIILAGIYTRGLNSGSSKSYAAFNDGNTFTQGVSISGSFALDPAGISNPANTATVWMDGQYNLFTNRYSTQTQTWYLPLISDYESLEQIEVSNFGGYEINIRPQSGGTINGFYATQKRLRLYAPGHCCKLRADKNTNTWIIVSMTGELTGA